MNIKQNIRFFSETIPNSVKLVAVSKTKPNEIILEAYQAGQKIFGENKIQDLVRKYEELPKDIEWHMIGHLQTNKVKYIAPFVGLIHAVDSLKLLSTINKEAQKNNRIIKCMFQLHIAEEDTKFGLDYNKLIAILDSEEFSKFQNIEIVGLMGMATYTEEEDQIRNEFKYLANSFKKIKNKYFSESEKFCEISMGMSGDYRIAIEEGSTMIRVGSLIFGART
ncbi:MAG: YggS family pyridoxal phosphate-dependent enzyme [Bacteroidetes bacterium]|jgi:PLP dependent protein|nr:YggS family pyridoxal phosphate-dependent enzyme [Bacteroidota bacterium]MBT6687719.1 YggS family pyridoxal phosphate-dependent enzyme [Bacteroidota bacterium]MBT7143687.1 YggS family pyridoxal phosphate-dependent enzyme [Bacteroidota bacterium]MBT7493293.1 YggS family pyridoxal phosphate-dependent enzyme [Bacteroidota bacterium]